MINDTFEKPFEQYIKEIRLTFESLAIYREILSDKVINKLYTLIDYLYRGNCDLCDLVSRYNDFYKALAEDDKTLSLTNYIIEYIIFDENVFSKSTEIANFTELDKSIKDVVKSDLEYLQRIAGINSQSIKEYCMEQLCTSSFEKQMIQNLPNWYTWSEQNRIKYECDINKELLTSKAWGECSQNIANFYSINSTGIFAKFKGFVWECQGDKRYLEGIKSPDPIRLNNLIGYKTERDQIIDNTLHFLKGYPANNMLLYGDRGTGKSSTVKALLNEYHAMGLRIIEIPRRFLTDLPEIIRLVKDKKLRFVFFIDDLAFEDSEESYTALKAILEGGLESRPENVVIYATSNRRHLIKEKFSDRAGIMSSNADDEVRALDTMQEKLSLADRFGITVTFSSPDQTKYLEIVDGLAQQRNLQVDADTLHRQALQWEMMYNGRSPRTARQFIDWLEGKLKIDIS